MLGGALSVLIFHPAPIYDPAAWMVWAAELVHRRPGLAAGPSWKPLPVIVTAPATIISWQFAFLFWLWIVRSATIATSVLLWRFASSRGGPVAGAIAAFAPFLFADWVQLMLGGGSEPVLMAAALGAVAAHRARMRHLAIALGVAAGLLRPEVWLFLGAYGIWLLRDDFRRWLLPLAAGAVAELVGWFAIPAIAGSDPFQASEHARIHEDNVVPTSEFLQRTWEAMPWQLWTLAAIGIVLAIRARDRLLILFAASAGAWIATVGVMTAFGFSGIGRYSLPAMVVLCIHAGTGATGVVASAGPRTAFRAIAAAGAALLVVTAVIVSAESSWNRFDKVREIDRTANEAHRVIAAAGGMERLVGICGRLGTNWTYATTLAWRERGSLGRLSRRTRAPGVLVLLDGAATKGQPVPPLGTTSSRTVFREGRWTIVSYAGSEPCRRPASSR